MIIITGANGRLGRDVVQRLLTRVQPGEVGVSVQDPEKAAELAARGVRVRRGDFADPASLAHSFEDATQVLLVSVNRSGDEALTMHRTAIRAAEAAGAEHLVYTSHVGVNPRSPFPPMADHAATEDLIDDTGLPYTALRNGFYTSTLGMLLEHARESGALVAPKDGPVSWTDHADLAEAATVALTEPERLHGPTPPLTAGQALDLGQVAEIASGLLGREITRVEVTEDDYRSAMVGRGAPEQAADFLLGMFAASRSGDFAPVDPTLARVLGHAPRSVRDVLADILPTG